MSSIGYAPIVMGLVGIITGLSSPSFRSALKRGLVAGILFAAFLFAVVFSADFRTVNPASFGPYLFVSLTGVAIFSAAGFALRRLITWVSGSGRKSTPPGVSSQ